jgi:hypothetical protein
MLYGGEIFKNEEYRKNSSFFPNLAGPDANLTLPPTTVHF